MKNNWSKRFFSGLLAAMLLLSVVPMAALAEENGELTLSVSSEDELLDVLQTLEAGDYDHATISLTASITLPRDLTIPANCTVEMVGDSVTLTNPAGNTVVNYGEIHVREQQTVYNYGRIDSYGKVYVSGTLYNYGLANLFQGSATSLMETGRVVNEGTAYIYLKADGEFDGEWEGDYPVFHTYAYGDANHDRKTNAKDATLVLQYSVGTIREGLTFCERCADVTGDGRFNAKDATMILQKSSGLLDKFPAEQ